MKRFFIIALCLFVPLLTGARRWVPKIAATAGLSVSALGKNYSVAQTTALSATPPTGTCVVAFITSVGTNHNEGHAMTSTTGTWVKIGGDGQAGTYGTSAWYLANCPSGITTITADGGAGCTNISVCVQYVTGASTSAPFTAGEFAVNHSLTPATLWTTGSVTNATPNSVGFAYCPSGSGSSTATMTINSSGTTGTWSLANSTTCQHTDGGTAQVFSAPSIIKTTSGATVHAWTTDSAIGATILFFIH